MLPNLLSFGQDGNGLWQAKEISLGNSPKTLRTEVLISYFPLNSLTNFLPEIVSLRHFLFQHITCCQCVTSKKVRRSEGCFLPENGRKERFSGEVSYYVPISVPSIKGLVVNGQVHFGRSIQSDGNRRQIALRVPTIGIVHSFLMYENTVIPRRKSYFIESQFVRFGLTDKRGMYLGIESGFLRFGGLRLMRQFKETYSSFCPASRPSWCSGHEIAFLIDTGSPHSLLHCHLLGIVQIFDVARVILTRRQCQRSKDQEQWEKRSFHWLILKVQRYRRSYKHKEMHSQLGGSFAIAHHSVKCDI